MIYNLEEYEPYIKDILSQVPLCYSIQLEKALMNTYEDIDQYLAHQILLAIQRKGFLFLSTDGWAMSKSLYLRISQDRMLTKIDLNEDNCRLGKMTPTIEKSRVAGEEIDCLWLAIDMLPESANFIAGGRPWSIMFETSSKTDDGGHLFQIVKIPKDKETARCELLKALPIIEDKKIQEAIIRIALIEDERHSWMVPHIGFTNICVLDMSNPRGYRIVEKRTGKEVWG